MELRPQEDDPEEQCHQTDALRPAVHVLSKTKLRTDWLQRSSSALVCVPLLATRQPAASQGNPFEAAPPAKGFTGSVAVQDFPPQPFYFQAQPSPSSLRCGGFHVIPK